MTDAGRVDALDRSGPWEGVSVLVVGFGAAGASATDNLLHLGARVVALDEPLDVMLEDERAGRAERAELLEVLGAQVRQEAGATAATGAALVAEGVDLVVSAPRWLVPGAEPEVVLAAREAGVPVWGEVELAWRLRDPAHPAPWLVAAGPGRAHVLALAETMLRAEGREPVLAGDVGLPLVEAVMDPARYDAVLVSLDVSMLSVPVPCQPLATVVLDVPVGEAALGRAYQGVEQACVYAVASPATEALVRDAEVQEGARAVGITLGTPEIGMLGLVEDILADRAFVAERRTSAAELGTLHDVLGGADPDDPVDPDVLVVSPLGDGGADDASSEHEDLDELDAETVAARLTRSLAAAALARAHGVSPAAVREGLRQGPADVADPVGLRG